MPKQEAPKGWSAEMDRKLAQVKSDPDAYFMSVRKNRKGPNDGLLSLRDPGDPRTRNADT